MWTLLLFMLAPTMDSPTAPNTDHPTAAVAGRMRSAADRLLAALPEKLRAQIQRSFDDVDRLHWQYTPGNRNGVALKQLDAAGRKAVHALLQEALSATGYRKVVNIVELELVLREIETFGLMRDPERYHLTIYGKPDPTTAWGWRFEGHHLSLNFTLAGDHLVVDTPSFLGANPATVPAGLKAAAKAGLRVLAAEEDEARAFLASLSDDQRRDVVFSKSTYGDIVTRNATAVDPLKPVGLSAAKMDDRQRALLLTLIEIYARTFEPSLAEARLARVREGGVEKINFGWAGATTGRGPYYYRVQGPLFLIEYDSSQDDGNHIHTVWRDFQGDFGRDLLRQHYQGAAAGQPGHSPLHRH
ncbi:MAG: hypothetical protein QOI66_532 [Myxococcales bacterium]|jgi:hypothetical protein|nr:hypothetical protein [Myxococcales bacterium]